MWAINSSLLKFCEHSEKMPSIFGHLKLCISLHLNYKWFTYWSKVYSTGSSSSSYFGLSSMKFLIEVSWHLCLKTILSNVIDLTCLFIGWHLSTDTRSLQSGHNVVSLFESVRFVVKLDDDKQSLQKYLSQLLFGHSTGFIGIPLQAPHGPILSSKSYPCAISGESNLI